MKKLYEKRFLFLTAIILCIMLFSCSQDSIFYDISFEPSPKTPVIPGGPSNIIVANNYVYAGSRMGNSIFAYGRTSDGIGWNEISLQGASLGDLATDGQSLYALVFPGGNPLRESEVRRFNSSSSRWESGASIQGYAIQSIFGAGNNIFVGIRSNPNSQNFSIALYNPSSNSFSIIHTGTSLLTGAAAGASGTYLATAGDGIFAYTGGGVTGPLIGTAGVSFSGIAEVGGSIVAVTGTGGIFHDSPGIFTSASFGVNFTGALSVWQDPNNSYRPTLLLMGIRARGSSINQVYREMVLNNGFPTFNIRVPGDSSPSSVASRSRYAAAVGRHPVESILQIPDISNGGPIDYRSYSGDPDWAPPIFASTSRQGLWSYRNGEWNTEE